MSIEQLRSRLPDYAKDIRLNLSSLVTTPEGLTEQQLWGALLASAIAARNAEVRKAIAAEAAGHLSEAAITAAKSAAAIMAMNNVYYRSIHLMSNKDYGKMPARLRMNVIGNPGVDLIVFDLWCVAVSAINGCGMCLDSHEKQLIEHGVEKGAIQSALRIAAVVQAAATVMDAETD